MNELQIVELENSDITTWDFESIKASLESALSVYESTVYTDDTIKSAKNDKATLAKAKKRVEDCRKAYKEQCLAPYNEIEPRIKELVNMIDDRKQMIDDVVKDYTDRQKQEKEKEVRRYYNQKSSGLGELADDLYEKILDPKWLNASTGRKKYEEEMLVAINKAEHEINEIKAMNSQFDKELLEEYTKTLSMDAVREKNEMYVNMAEKFGVSNELNTENANPEDSSISGSDDSKNENSASGNEEQGTLIRVYASQKKIEQITDFMNAIGVRFEIE